MTLNEFVRKGMSIVIIGSGTLALDVVTNIVEGGSLGGEYQEMPPALLPSQRARGEQPVVIPPPERLARVTVLCRRSRPGLALLDDAAASIVAARRTLVPNLDIVTNVEVESFSYQVDVCSGKKWISAVNLNCGTSLSCDLVIEAIGVECNSKLAREAGLEVRPRARVWCSLHVADAEHVQVSAITGGICVDSNFRSTRDDRVFAVGDCCEFVNDFESIATGKIVRSGECGTMRMLTFFLHHASLPLRKCSLSLILAVWKNWTASREVFFCVLLNLCPPFQMRISFRWGVNSLSFLCAASPAVCCSSLERFKCLRVVENECRLEICSTCIQSARCHVWLNGLLSRVLHAGIVASY